MSLLMAFTWPKNLKAITRTTVYIGIAMIIASGPPRWPTISRTMKIYRGVDLMLVE